MKKRLFVLVSLVGLSFSVKAFSACSLAQTLRMAGKKPGLFPAGGRNVCEVYLSPKQYVRKFDAVFWGKIVREKRVGLCLGVKDAECIANTLTFEVRKVFKGMDAKSIDVFTSVAANPQRTHRSIKKGVFLATCGLMRPVVGHSWMIFAKRNAKGKLESSTFYCNPSFRTEFLPDLIAMEKDFLLRKQKK